MSKFFDEQIDKYTDELMKLSKTTSVVWAMR